MPVSRPIFESTPFETAVHPFLERDKPGVDNLEAPIYLVLERSDTRVDGFEHLPLSHTRLPLRPHEAVMPP